MSSWTIGFICLLIMAFVIVLSITLNVIFRRMEYEKIAKYCCTRLRRVLNQNGVISKMTTLRLIFD